MRLYRRAHQRSARRERGAVAVEAALVTPLLLIMLFGIIEFSFLMKDNVAVSSAVRVGGRMASSAAGAGPGTCPTGPTAPVCTPANAPAFAQAAADAIQRAGSAMPKNSIEYIWVYKANNSGYPGSSTSMPTSCPSDCVKYVWSDGSPGRFYYASGSWSSKSVRACLNDSESVGIYMRAKHDFITGLFGSAITVADHAVMKFEPLATDMCAPDKHP